MPGRLLTIIIVGLILTYASSGPVSAFGRCVKFCDDPGGYVDNDPPTWDPPEHDEPTRSTLSPRKQKAMALAIEGFNAWKNTRDTIAEDSYRRAYALFPENESIRRGFCTVMWNIGVKTADLQKDYQGAVAYMEKAIAICPNKPSFQETIRRVRYWLETKAQEAKTKLQKKVSAESIQELLEDFEMFIPASTPPEHFEFARPGTPMFSKGTRRSAPVVAEGEFRAAAADISNQTNAAQTGFRMRPVPLPPEIQAHYKKHDPFGGTPKGPTRTTDLILDALAYGKGYLDDSLLYLTRKVGEEGENRHGIVALSYLQGLYLGAENFSESEPTDEQVIRKLLSGRDTAGEWDKEIFRQVLEGEDDHWIAERRELINQALTQGDGDLAKSLDYLLKSRKLDASFYSGAAQRSDDRIIAHMEDHVGWSAYYYLLGLQAYPVFVDSSGGEGRAQ